MSAIGDLETLVLLAVLRLGEDAYGVSVRDEIARRAERRLTRGSIYTAVRRLEAKGFLEGELGEPTPERGGRAKRFLRVTPAGLEAVREATRAVARMADGLELEQA